MGFATRWGTLVIGAFLFLAPQAHALKFSNQFVEFELPTNWKCLLEGADWVCQSEDKVKKSEAIIVLAAKLKGEQDSLEKYQDYLAKPRNFPSVGGKPVVSQPKYTANKKLGDQMWVDSLHLESEIPGFFTRYLATVFKDIGVLVTYSVNKTKFADYQKQFDDMVSSLKVFHKAGAINGRDANLFANANGAMGAGIFSGGAGDAATQMPTAPVPKANKGGGGGGGGSMGLLLVIAAGAGGFIYWKKKQASGG